MIFLSFYLAIFMQPQNVSNCNFGNLFHFIVHNTHENSRIFFFFFTDLLHFTAQTSCILEFIIIKRIFFIQPNDV